MHACLWDNKDKLTEDCRREELKLKIIQSRDIRLRPKLNKLCSEEIAVFCKDVKPGDAQHGCHCQPALDLAGHPPGISPNEHITFHGVVMMRTTPGPIVRPMHKGVPLPYLQHAYRGNTGVGPSMASAGGLGSFDQGEPKHKQHQARRRQALLG